MVKWPGVVLALELEPEGGVQVVGITVEAVLVVLEVAMYKSP
jgi:hypothetical protein